MPFAELLCQHLRRRLRNQAVQFTIAVRPLHQVPEDDAFVFAADVFIVAAKNLFVKNALYCMIVSKRIVLRIDMHLL